jgi:hypothetical protein
MTNFSSHKSHAHKNKKKGDSAALVREADKDAVKSREESLLSILFVLGTEMKHLKNKNNNKILGAAATIFTLAIIFASTTTLVSASTTGSNNTTTTTMSVGGEEQEAVSSTITTTTNNASNALLGRLFSYDEGEDVESNVNPVNETYIEVSYSGNRIILPPNSTDIINATEIGNVTINIQPNGLSFNQGHAVIMTKGDAAAGQEGDENANISFVLLTRTNPDGSGSGTSVTYFSTNSTGQLAFLDNLVAIGQVEYSPEEGINRFVEWEWKGGTIPFENLLPQP